MYYWWTTLEKISELENVYIISHEFKKINGCKFKVLIVSNILQISTRKYTFN